MHLTPWTLLVPILFLTTVLAPAHRLPVSQVVIMGQFSQGPVEVPVAVSASSPGTPFDSGNPAAWPAEAQMRLYFANGGTSAEIIRLDPLVSLATSLRGRFATATATFTFSGSGLLTLLTDCGFLVIPQLSDLPAADFNAVMENLRPLAASRHFLLILDPPSSATSVSAITSWAAALPQDLDFVQLTFPRLLVERSLLLPGSPDGPQIPLGGSGAVAAVTTRMDQQQGRFLQRRDPLGHPAQPHGNPSSGSLPGWCPRGQHAFPGFFRAL